MAFITATQARDLMATVVNDGASPAPLDFVKDIQGPVMVHYGEKDPSINKGIPDTEAAMRNTIKFMITSLSGAEYAFTTT